MIIHRISTCFSISSNIHEYKAPVVIVRLHLIQNVPLEECYSKLSLDIEKCYILVLASPQALRDQVAVWAGHTDISARIPMASLGV